jgi:hypothetical protein
MRRILGLAAAVLMAIACSSGSGTGSANLCGQIRPKLDGCGFHNMASKGSCTADEDSFSTCYANCALELPCDAFVAAYCHQDFSGFAGCLDKCEPAPFQCADGESVSGDAKCDGDEECTDGSDEAGCPTTDCGDGETYVQKEKCDGYEACQNGADEVGCPGSITCGDGTTVGESSHCDGYDDCSGGEDEAGCVLVTCSDGTTFPADYKCDGFDDCSDGGDEVGCSGSGGSGNSTTDLIALDCQSLP